MKSKELKILFIDDDESLLEGLKRRLHRKYPVDTAVSAKKGMAMLERFGPYAVVISDQQMPEMDGLTFLAEINEKFPYSTRIMLTGNADRETAVQSVNKGNVFRYLNKPCGMQELSEAIDAGIELYQKRSTERKMMEQTLTGSINLLTKILETKEPERFQKLGIMRSTATRLSKAMRYKNNWELHMTIMLSPLGELMLPDELRMKIANEDELSEEEKDQLCTAPNVAKELLANIPRLVPVSKAIHYMNKGFDGSGYPEDEVSGTDIPMNARIMFLLQALMRESRGKPPTRDHFLSLKSTPELYDPELMDVAQEIFSKE